MGPPPVLSEGEEQVIVKWITVSKKGFPQRKLGVQLSFKEFLTGNQKYTF
jgi:hypothetical protein